MEIRNCLADEVEPLRHPRRMSEGRRHEWYIDQWVKFVGNPSNKALVGGTMREPKFSELRTGKKKTITLDDLADVCRAFNAFAPTLNLHPSELLQPPELAMTMRPFQNRWKELAALSDAQIDDAIDYAVYRARQSTSQEEATRKIEQK